MGGIADHTASNTYTHTRTRTHTHTHTGSQLQSCTTSRPLLPKCPMPPASSITNKIEGCCPSWPRSGARGHRDWDGAIKVVQVEQRCASVASLAILLSKIEGAIAITMCVQHNPDFCKQRNLARTQLRLEALMQCVTCLLLSMEPYYMIMIMWCPVP